VDPITRLAEDTAEVIPQIDSETTGQYGDGIGSEDEEHQIALILEKLRELDDRYWGVKKEVDYPDASASCDLVLPDGTPVEAKLLRYWRANGDAEEYMYTHVFSPFHENTLLTDARRLHESGFDRPKCLLGLFYKRADNDPVEVSSLPERFTVKDLAEKAVQDIRYWYDFEANVRKIASFEGLQHPVHRQGAVITWVVE
jgi:hypothetical protein